jgi:hypothetical protein
MSHPRDHLTLGDLYKGRLVNAVCMCEDPRFLFTVVEAAYWPLPARSRTLAMRPFY